MDAFNAMKRLRQSEMLAARDIYYAQIQLEAEAEVIQGRTYFSRLVELWTIPRVRRGTIAASTVMLAQQMCGINIIAFYSSSIFAESGYTSSQALYASLGFGAVNFLFAFPAVFTIDTCEYSTVIFLEHSPLTFQSVDDLSFWPLSLKWPGPFLPLVSCSSWMRRRSVDHSESVLLLCKLLPFVCIDRR